MDRAWATPHPKGVLEQVTQGPNCLPLDFLFYKKNKPLLVRFRPCI